MKIQFYDILSIMQYVFMKTHTHSTSVNLHYSVYTTHTLRITDVHTITTTTKQMKMLHIAAGKEHDRAYNCESFSEIQENQRIFSKTFRNFWESFFEIRFQKMSKNFPKKISIFHKFSKFLKVSKIFRKLMESLENQGLFRN